MKVTIEQGVDRGGRVGLLVTTPYSEDFVESLKAQLPSQDRRWSPDQDGWWVSADHLELVTFLCLQHWPGLTLCGLEGEDDQIIQRDGHRTAQPRLL